MMSMYIFGTGEIGEVAHYYFQNHSEHNVTHFVLDPEYIEESNFLGLPVISSEEMLSLCPANTHSGFAAIGYSRVNRLRAEVYQRLKDLGYTMASYISEKATIYSDKIGDNVFLLEDNTIQPFVRIGNNVTLWSGNHIGHHSVIEDHAFLASHIVVSGGVHIGAYTFIGVNATIRDHINIGKGNVIGAGALLLKDTEEDEIYPARRTHALEGKKASQLRKI